MMSPQESGSGPPNEIFRFNAVALLRAATANATLIDLRNGVSVRSLTPMAFTRGLHNSVVLPSGQVVVVGGMAVDKVFSEDAARLTPELWDPRLENFARLPAAAVARVYHSTALLLADGRVLSGGGGQCGACSVNHFNVQILTPPYLVNPDGTPAPRPAIQSAPATAALGSTIAVTADRTVAAFALLRMSSVTHSVNNEQRRIPLSFTTLDKRTYSLKVPADPGVGACRIRAQATRDQTEVVECDGGEDVETGAAVEQQSCD